MQQFSERLLYKISTNLLVNCSYKPIAQEVLGRTNRLSLTLHFGGRARNYINGAEGSQAVFPRPSGRGNAYDRN
jgi:hypothetical protein